MFFFLDAMDITHPSQMLILGGTGSGKTSILTGTILGQMDFDHIFISTCYDKPEDSYGPRAIILRRDGIALDTNHITDIVDALQNKKNNQKLLIIDDFSNADTGPFQFLISVLARQINTSIIYIIQNLNNCKLKSEILNNVNYLCITIDSYMPMGVLENFLTTTRSQVHTLLRDIKSDITHMKDSNIDKGLKYAIFIRKEGTLESDSLKYQILDNCGGIH